MAAGRRVLELEAAEVASAGRRLDARFARAVELLAVRGGRVIVSGVGKSGLVARKLAATLTSTGTPATYLHPVDSLHGDLGIVGGEDVAIVLSKSGESSDLDGLLASLERKGVPIIAITGEPGSFLGRVATTVLDASVSEEACPHDLAPTSSTAVAMALGDALAVALLVEKASGPRTSPSSIPAAGWDAGSWCACATSCCRPRDWWRPKTPCARSSSSSRAIGASPS